MQTIATNPVPKKLPESTLAHGAAEAALQHRHHLIVRLGAGPIRFVYDSRSKDRKKERKTLEALPRDTLIQVEIGTKGGIQNKGK